MRAGCISSSLYAGEDNLLEYVKQNVKCYILWEILQRKVVSAAVGNDVI